MENTEEKKVNRVVDLEGFAFVVFPFSKEFKDFLLENRYADTVIEMVSPCRLKKMYNTLNFAECIAPLIKEGAPITKFYRDLGLLQSLLEDKLNTHIIIDFTENV